MISGDTATLLLLPIRIPENSASEQEQRALEVEETLSRARMLWSIDNIHNCSPSTLAAMKASLWHGEELGRWGTPEKWLPNAVPAERSIDLAAKIVHNLPKHQRILFRPEKGKRKVQGRGRPVRPLAEVKSRLAERRVLNLAVEQLVRLLVLLRMGPAGMGRKGAGRELDPSTIAALALFTLPKVIAMGLSRRLASPRGLDEKDLRFFAHVTQADYRKLPKGVLGQVEAEMKRMHVLADRGLWTDVVPNRPSVDRTTPVKGDAQPRKAPKSVDPHKPLPDAYVSQVGLHCQWIIKELGPAALRVAQEVEDLWIRTERPDASDAAIAQVREDALRPLLANARWLDSQGKPIACLPFTGRPTHVRQAARWPVKTFSQLTYIFKLVQCAHVFVAGLSFTTRHSELTTLRRDCIVPASDGLSFVSGRTWKLVDRHDGDAREWVLPDLAMTAIEQQVKLVRICERINRRNSRIGQLKEGTHLFAQIGGASADNRKRLTAANGPLQWFAAAMGMEAMPGGQRLRVHRFRKTIARLAALAITQAPKVLMHVFGHADIDSTLYYILEDKELQGEIETVAREMRVMMAKETVEALWEAEKAGKDAGFSGPASATLSRAIAVERQGAHQRGEDFGAKNMWRLAEIVSLQGKAWQLVRPGIWCTKYPGTESGPCNQSRGRPEPSRCQSQCKHRLETPYARQDADGSIEQCVKGYKRACRERKTHMKEFWSRQCAFHLPRFADLRAKWGRNKTVREMLALIADFGEVAS